MANVTRDTHRSESSIGTPAETFRPRKRRPRRREPLELVIATATLLTSTLAYLAKDPRMTVIALVLGGIAYGIVLARSDN